MKLRDFFTDEQKKAIKAAIQAAEKNTSGEIRVRLESKCPDDAVKRAILVFEKLNMHKTALRNGVLIYLAVDDRKMAIIGDRGIDEKVPENFWVEVKENMRDHFAKGQFTEGLCAGIEAAGEKLKAYFPFQKDDINELNDDISFEKE